MFLHPTAFRTTAFGNCRKCKTSLSWKKSSWQIARRWSIAPQNSSYSWNIDMTTCYRQGLNKKKWRQDNRSIMGAGRVIWSIAPQNSSYSWRTSTWPLVIDKGSSRRNTVKITGPQCVLVGDLEHCHLNIFGPNHPSDIGLTLWSCEPSQLPWHPRKFKDTQNGLKSDFRGFPQSDTKLSPKVTFWPQMWLKSRFWGHFWVTLGKTPRKSLLSHFGVSLKFSGVWGSWGGRKEQGLNWCATLIGCTRRGSYSAKGRVSPF